MAYVSVHWRWRHFAPSFRPPSSPGQRLFSPKKPTVRGTILSTPTLTLRTHLLLYPAKIFSRALSATQPKKYTYADPIPEFAAAETQKFKAELLKKLSKQKDTFGNDLNTVVNICSEIGEVETQMLVMSIIKFVGQENFINRIWNVGRPLLGSFEKLFCWVYAFIFNEFLHQEYGGPGTLLVEPFTDMMIVLKEKKLPGAPLAARTSLLWAQNYVDQDWESWISKSRKV